MARQVDYTRPCHALLRLDIIVSEPVVDEGGNKGNTVIHINNGAIGIELDGYEHTDLIKQIYDKIGELKTLWPKTISLENLQADAIKTMLPMEEG